MSLKNSRLNIFSNLYGLDLFLSGSKTLKIKKHEFSSRKEKKTQAGFNKDAFVYYLCLKRAFWVENEKFTDVVGIVA